MSRKQRAFFVLLAAICGHPSAAIAQGPDRGGYRWVDSDTLGGAAFEWVDITANGTRIVLGDDDNQGPFELGFPFSFYARSFASIRVCSNGWLSFTSNSHQFHHYAFPDRLDPNALLAPLWADLDPSAGGAVYYRAESGRFVVSWVAVPRYGRPDSSTFQVIIDTAGAILFQYLRLPGGIDSCSTGIENDSGSTGLTYSGDGVPSGNRLHDSLAIRFFRLDLDVCPARILRPFEQEFCGDDVVPAIRVWNPGLSPASFPVTLRIGDAYEEQLSVADLASLKDTALFFPTWVPGADSYALEVFTSLAGDQYPANDTLDGTSAGAFAGELRYDDGGRDTWYFRAGAPNRDWAAGVRFTLPYAACRLTGARIFVGDVLPFEQVLLCPGDTAAPDVQHAWLRAESVAAAAPGTWLEVQADTMLTSASDWWLLAFWPRGATGPRIGQDLTQPVDGRSYFGSPTLRWFPVTAGDLQMRLRIDGGAGVTELEPVRPRQFRADPNPFTRQVAFTGLERFSVAVHAVDGRRLAHLRAEHGRIVWRPDHLPRGIYFARVEAPHGRAALPGALPTTIKLVCVVNR
jgi:hypothetical protein